MKQLHANKWYWYIGALLCIVLSVYWLITFMSRRETMDIFVGIVTLGIGISAFWRARHPQEQEVDHTHTS